MEKPLVQHMIRSGFIVLIAFASFGLGRLSLFESNKTPLSIDYFSSSSTPANISYEQASVALAVIPGVKGVTQVHPITDTIQDASSTITSNFQIVASKKGKRYYYSTCKGAQNLSVANKVYYKTALEAKNAGLVVATGCKAPQ